MSPNAQWSQSRWKDPSLQYLPFFIIIILKFMNFKADCWMFGASSWSLSAQVWQCLFFPLPMQASHEKGAESIWFKVLPNLCLLTREAFSKGVRSTENLSASFEKKKNIQIAPLYSRPHRLKSFLKWKLHKGKKKVRKSVYTFVKALKSKCRTDSLHHKSMLQDNL